MFHANPLFITEGFFDCLILQQNGFETISPGTVSFSNRELQILCSILPKQTQVYLCNDNELNRAGEKGAVAMAIHLAKNGYNVRIANIPLKESHIDARRKLEELNRGS